jgi:hypothetical protein
LLAGFGTESLAYYLLLFTVIIDCTATFSSIFLGGTISSFYSYFLAGLVSRDCRVLDKFLLLIASLELLFRTGLISGLNTF